MKSKNQSVKVAIRVRPLNKRQTQMNSPLCVQSKQNVLIIKKQADAKEFLFDYVFDMNTRQQQIYQNSAFSLMENGLDGYNGTIFAYGQTGAGKTFTMVGDYKDPQYKGIIPRGFQHLISAIQTSQDKRYVMRASFIEIYNQEIIDLLEDKVKGKSQKKDLKQNPGKGVYIKDLKMIPVKSVDQLFKILDFGNTNRTVFATAMNAVSSRSHALFTVHIESLEGNDKVKASKINLVDLAGSQRQSKTQATGDRLKEGAKINLSLSALGNVINALVDGRSGHIPYRDSKLTRLLQDSLGGNTKTLMIASISPALFNYDETLSTLRYAARARNIKNTPKINQDPKDAMIRQYLQQIEKLKKQLTIGGNQINLSIKQQKNNQQDNQLLKKVQQKMSQNEKQLQQKQSQLLKMKQKLKQMQGLKNKKKKIMKQQQLLNQKISDLAQQDQKLLNQNIQNKKYQSVQKQLEYYKRLSKQLQKKIKNILQDKKDIEQQFQLERQDLNVTIRQMQGDLNFYQQIASKFMSDSDLALIKTSSIYDQEKRKYQLAAFLIHQQQVTLPKTLKKHQVDDLWTQKRKNYKLQLISNQLPQIVQNKSFKLDSPIKLSNTKYASPFIQNRKLFKMADYNNPIYQEKQYDPNQSGKIFRGTKYRINQDSRSRSRSQHRSTSKTKLQPIQNKFDKTQSTQQKRPISRSKLTPIISRK